MKYLLDTDIVIDFLRGREEARATLIPLLSAGVAVSTVTLAEYFHGVFLSKRGDEERERLRQFITDTQPFVLVVTERIAEKYGELQAGLEKVGERGNGFDILIAATAMMHNLILVTRNIKDFQKVGGLRMHG